MNPCICSKSSYHIFQRRGCHERSDRIRVLGRVQQLLWIYINNVPCVRMGAASWHCPRPSATLNSFSQDLEMSSQFLDESNSRVTIHFPAMSVPSLASSHRVQKGVYISFKREVVLKFPVHYPTRPALWTSARMPCHPLAYLILVRFSMDLLSLRI